MYDRYGYPGLFAAYNAGPERYDEHLRDGRPLPEFGRDGILAIADRFVEAERADFHWDGRLAEMNLGAYESFGEEDQAFEAVAIIGYFRGRYYVATCVVDAERHVRRMLHLRHVDSFASAEQAFLAGGG